MASLKKTIPREFLIIQSGLEVAILRAAVAVIEVAAAAVVDIEAATEGEPHSGKTRTRKKNGKRRKYNFRQSFNLH